MKICQTLWCNDKDLLKDTFGWYSPQHHLMAWAYSCLKLRAFYPQVELYTDSQGAEYLIDIINLPYTECHIEYDDLRYNPSLWALPKVLTYSKQKEPFIHVDGDVFIWDKFRDTLVNSRLIAQNLEVGTSCYKRLFEPILKNLTYVPDIFRENLFAMQPKAYNAGILGGNDLDLLQEYSKESIKFVDMNMNCHSNHNINMIFEQLLLYSIAQKHDVRATCYYDKVFNDNAYTMDDFADFMSVPKLKYLHTVGPLKRNKFICDQLEKRIFHEYPFHFEKIISLFSPIYNHGYLKNKTINYTKENHNVKQNNKLNLFRTRILINTVYPGVDVKTNKSTLLFVKNSNNKILSEILAYEKRVHYIISKKFSHININDIENLELKIIKSNEFLENIENGNFSNKLYLNPYIEIIESLLDVANFDPYNIVQDDMSHKKTVACVPQLLSEGYKEVDLGDVSINMILTLYEASGSMSFVEFKEAVSSMFERVENDEDYILHLIMECLKYLIGNNIIFLVSKE